MITPCMCATRLLSTPLSLHPCTLSMITHLRPTVERVVHNGHTYCTRAQNRAYSNLCFQAKSIAVMQIDTKIQHGTSAMTRDTLDYFLVHRSSPSLPPFRRGLALRARDLLGSQPPPPVVCCG